MPPRAKLRSLGTDSVRTIVGSSSSSTTSSGLAAARRNTTANGLAKLSAPSVSSRSVGGRTTSVRVVSATFSSAMPTSDTLP